MVRLAFVTVLSACAIHRPPAEPPDSPETWTKPSVRRDCDAKCGGTPEPYLARCMNVCELSEPVVWRCGMSSMRRSSGLPRTPLERLAVAVGVAGIVAVSLVAAGVIAPSP